MNFLDFTNYPQKLSAYLLPMLRVAGALAFIFRVMLDIAFVSTGYTDVERVITSSLSLMAAAIAGYFYYRYECDNIAEKNGKEFSEFISARLKSVIYISLIIILGTILAGMVTLANHTLPANVFSAIIYDIVAACIVFASFSLFSLHYCVTQLRRHPKTLVLTKIMLIGVGAALVLQFLLSLSGKPSTMLDVSATAYLLVVGLLNIRKMQWVDALTSREKRRLLGLGTAGCITTFSVWITIQATDFDIALDFFLPSLYLFFKISSLLASVYCGRLAFASLMALPTARVVDRRNSEVDSLTYLNRIVAETIDVEKLTEIVTERARHVCNASAAWIEMRSEQERIIAAPIGISHGQIEWLHINSDFDSVVSNCSESFLIESLEEHPQLAPLGSSAAAFVKSLIAIPLLSGNSRIGTLIVVKPESYGFEYDDMRLLAAFRDNVSIALENARLLHDSMQNERIRREMVVAHAIQQRLLPQQIPSVNGFDIAAMSHPAYEVGGDYYDMVKLCDGSLCILIGDVSGKGIPAAFYMAQLKGAVLALACEVTGARDFLMRINATLFGSIERQIYITLQCVVLRENPASITIARAGHMPALIKQHGGVAVVTPKGMGIGLVSPQLFNRALEEFSMPLTFGDACLLFTDGISESRNQNSDELGYEPLLNVLRSPAADSATSILKAVEDAVAHHAGCIEQHDDITALAIVYKGNTSKVLIEHDLDAPVSAKSENILQIAASTLHII